MSKFSILDFSITHLKSHYSIFQKTSALLSAHSPMAYQWMSQITVFQICHLSCLTEAGILHLYSADLQSYCNHQHHLWFYDHKTASSPLPHTSSTASYFLLFFTIQKVVSITCHKAVKIQNTREEDQWKGTQNHPKRRKNILSISVIVFKQSNMKLSRSRRNILLKRQ